MHVGLFSVPFLFFGLVVIVTMGQCGVVVLMRVPRCAMVPLVEHAVFVMMGHVVVVMGMADSGMGMFRLLALALGILRTHQVPPVFTYGAPTGLLHAVSHKPCHPSRRPHLVPIIY